MQLLLSFELKNCVDTESSQKNRQCCVLSYFLSTPNSPRLLGDDGAYAKDMCKLHNPLSADFWLASSTGGWKAGGGQLPCSFLFVSSPSALPGPHP